MIPLLKSHKKPINNMADKENTTIYTSMGRWFIIIGIILILLGLLWPFFGKILGRLPGDIIIKQENFTFYFPLATSFIISLILSAVIWFIRR